MGHPLIPMLIRAVATGAAAGIAAGLALAQWHPDLNQLLLEQESMARLAFLMVVMQAGSAVSLVLAFAFDRTSEPAVRPPAWEHGS
jgi:hypothetical protein